METKLLRGKKIADQVKAEVQEEIAELKQIGYTPSLTVIIVGEDPASRVYTRGKVRTCRELGMESELIELPEETTTEELLAVIGRLNNDDELDGILVQLPLPSQIDEEKVLKAIHPAKDVDGFHPRNVGKLFLGKETLTPCTPTGIVDMLRREEIPLKGSHAVIVGRSNIVGKPLALQLLQEHCTVTICHSRTRDLPGVCRNADILIAAVGAPALVTKDFLKAGVVIVDVGINRVDDREELIRLFGHNEKRLEGFQKRGYTLVGDVHPTDPVGIASALTPVPGGVGPLTIAHLMRNTVTACRRRRARAPLMNK
jgi:methylenetetrahydrofolate dehydrogenase (NADP+)/methenyltetrahydrofolate cyclohydrolase